MAAGGALVAGAAVARLADPLSGAVLLAAAAAAWALAPFAARAAARLGATVLPGGRSIHEEPTPLLGGLAIVLPVFAVLLLEADRKSLALAAGVAILAAAGVFDDLRRASPRFKLAAQTLAALALVAGGFRAELLHCPPFGDVEVGGFEAPLLVFWVLLATNAINLIDGMDGLAAGIALFGALATVALGAPPVPSAALAGALFGFLRHNLPRARIFLGDAGSLTLGFLLAAFLLEAPGGANLPVSIGLLALPLGDVAFSALRRWLRGKPIFAADRGHVHHVLLHFWGSVPRVLGALLLFAAAQTLTAVLLPNALGLGLAALLWISFGVYLVARKRPRWRRILGNRRGFKRAHLVRRYAEDAIRLAESVPEVRGVLERVSADFRLRALEVGPVALGDRGSHGAAAGERVPCGGGVASFALGPAEEDPVLTEEKRTILCYLLRSADERLRMLDPFRRFVLRVTAGSVQGPVETARREAPAEERGFGLRLPRAHFVVVGRGDLARVEPLVRETRSRGALDPAVVHSGRRDDLGVFDAVRAAAGGFEPDVDLDVPDTGDASHAQRVIDRYDALLDAGAPAVVVVLGDSAAAAGCAVVAKRRGIPVAHLLDGDGGFDRAVPRAMNRVIAAAAADLAVPANGPGSRQPLDFDATLVVPAIERLAVPRPPS